MQLGAAHHDAVAVAADDAHIEIGIVLLVGAALAVAFRIGDHFGGAQIVVAAIAVHALDIFRILRIHGRDLVLDAHQRHVDAGDGRADAGMRQQLDALVQILLAARNLIDAVRLAPVFGLETAQGAQLGIVVIVIPGRARDGNPETRMLRDIVDPFAIPIGHASVAQAFDILFRCLERHRSSSLFPGPSLAEVRRDRNLSSRALCLSMGA